MKRLLPFLLCFGVGLTVGLLLRRMQTTTAGERHAVTVTNVRAEPVGRSIFPRHKPLSSAVEELRSLISSAGYRGRFALRSALPLISQLPLADCRAVFDMVRKSPLADRDMLLVLLGERWVEQDAVDALGFAVERPDEHHFTSRIGDMAAAVLVQTDPGLALEKIALARNSSQRQRLAEWILPALARTDARRAAAYFSSGPGEFKNQDRLRYQIAVELGRSAPAEALAWANSFGPGAEEAVLGAWNGWADTDARAAAAAVMTDSKARSNPRIISIIAGNFSRQNFGSSLLWIQSLPEEKAREAAYGSLHFEDASLAPGEARQVISSIRSKQTAANVAQDLGRQLASNNVEDALAWASSLPDTRVRSSAYDSIVATWSEKDPMAAAQFIASQPFREGFENALAQAVRLWSENDRDAAHAYVHSLPQGPAKDAAFGGILEEMNETDQDKVLGLFASVKDPDVLGRMAEKFVGQLAATNPVAAFQLASQVPTNAQPQVVGRLVRSWAAENKEAAGAWLQNMSAGPVRDSAVRAYVSVIDGEDAGAATRWAYTISETTERVEAMFPAFERWLNEDQNAAQAWLQDAAIPDGLRPFFEKLIAEKTSGRDRD